MGQIIMPMNFSKSPPNMSSGPKGNEMDIVSSHQRLLIAAAMRTTGTMLELGCGWYSTPLLHEIAVAQKRLLITMDNQPYWLPMFKGFECGYHLLEQVDWWGNANFQKSYGMVLVDQGQPIEREYTTRRLLKESDVDVFVFHDTEEKLAYGYERILPMFKYRWTDKAQPAWTTIASNKVDVTKWGLVELKTRGLTEDVT